MKRERCASTTIGIYCQFGDWPERQHPGQRDLFADPGLPDYNEPATALGKRRVLSLLAKVCQRRVGGT